MRQVVLFQDEDGRWVATVPSLPGCVTDGGTMEEALANAKEAIEACIEALQQEGRPVPEERFNTRLVAV
ncbi:MAG: type II toxin-antitoxin system HicB family antitoxin [Deltaproteobacteria bacterium]|nr:type II toxin-antitoxin system HicB family antitoxin [Deltaproteobacteria bacterium]